MPIKFSERALGTPVSKYIRDIFKELETGGFTTNPLGEVKPKFEKYLGDNTTFARMWSPLLISSSVSHKIIYHTVNDNRNLDYAPNQTLTGNIVNELNDNKYLNPKAGITSISSKTEGAYGAVRRTEVQFIVHNKTDFDTIYVPYFLKPNATIVLDYGWSEKDIQLYNVDGVIDNADLELKGFKDFIYGIPKEGPNGETGYVDGDGELKYKTSEDVVTKLEFDKPGFVNQYKGKVNVESGRVIDFNSKLNNQGSYECSLTFINEGASLLDATITEENGLKYLFTTQFEEILIELLSTQTKEGESFSSDQFLQYDVLNADSKREVREGFYKNLGLASSLTGATETVGTLKVENLRSGVFYQDTTLVLGKASNQIDSGYISYGLFEDLFLNALVLENLSENQTHAVQYLSHDCFISYDENLLLRQKELPANDEGLSLFLYPPKSSELLRKGYNSRTQFKSLTSEQTIKVYKDMLDGKHEGFSKSILPIRDLFISIKLITKAFEGKQNINDALENIIDGLNKDSYGVFKLKMIAANESYSAIGLADANLHKGFDNKTLTFDITENSIVSNIDFNYNSPKGDLASMLAIGEDDSLDFFDDDDKDRLKFLSIFGPDKEELGTVDDVRRINLPLTKPDNPNKKEKLSNRNFKYEKASKILKKIKVSPKNNSKDKWVDKINNLSSFKKNLAKTSSGTEEGATGPKISRPSGKALADKRLKATSMQDYYGKLAKQFVYGSDDNSAPSIIPGDLSLTIYGNNYLQIGDLLTINYLPKHISDKISYVITAIEHKVDSKWETTYSTRPFIKPTQKKTLIGKIEEPIFGKEVIVEEIRETSPVNKGFEESIVGAKVIKLENNYVTAKLIESIYDDETFNTLTELKKTDTTGGVKKLGGTYVINQFEAMKENSWLEYYFLSAVQTTVLDTWLKGGYGDEATRVQLFTDKLPEDVSVLYNKNNVIGPDFGKPPGIIINGLVEVEDYAPEDSYFFNLFGTDLPNAAKEYLTPALGQFVKSDAKEKGILIENILKYVASRNANKNFYDQYIEGLASEPKMTNSNPLIELKISGDWKKEGIRQSQFGMTFSSFAFNMASYSSTSSVFSYLMDFQLPLLSQTFSRKLIIPKWFLDNAKITPNDFVNSVYKLYTDQTLIKSTQQRVIEKGTNIVHKLFG